MASNATVTARPDPARPSPNGTRVPVAEPPVAVRPPVTVRPRGPRRPILAVPGDTRPATPHVMVRPGATRIPTPTEARPGPEPQTSAATWPELLTEPDAPELAPRTDEGWRLDRLAAEQEGRTWNG